ncbi:MAG: T9SS type A sorting domain-containing protein [Bacteroidota bacterium]
MVLEPSFSYLTQNQNFNQMKMLKRLFLLAGLMAFASLSVQAQVCDPDTTVTQVGLSPDTLPTAYVGQPYNQIINAALPTDTTIVIPLQFCSYRIVSISPPLDSLGLSFECDQGDCNYQVDHTVNGNLNWGCVVISGIPTIENDSVTVFLEATIGTYVAATDTCVVSTALPPIPYTLALTIVDTTTQDTTGNDTTTSVFSYLTKEDLGMNVFPNPTDDQTMLSLDLPETADLKVEVVDLMGRQVVDVFEGRAFAGTKNQAINTSALPDGIYLIRTVLNQGELVLTEKLVIRK